MEFNSRDSDSDIRVGIPIAEGQKVMLLSPANQQIVAGKPAVS